MTDIIIISFIISICTMKSASQLIIINIGISVIQCHKPDRMNSKKCNS